MFCKQCGNELSVSNGKCSKCGTTIGKGGRFCPDCGKKITNPKEPCDCKKHQAVPVVEGANDKWVCTCGETNTKNFCQNCGSKKIDVLGSPAAKEYADDKITDNETVNKVEVKTDIEKAPDSQTVKKPQFKNPVFAKIAAKSKTGNSAVADTKMKEAAIKLVYGEEALKDGSLSQFGYSSFEEDDEVENPISTQKSIPGGDTKKDNTVSEKVVEKGRQNSIPVAPVVKKNTDVVKSEDSNKEKKDDESLAAQKNPSNVTDKETSERADMSVNPAESLSHVYPSLGKNSPTPQKPEYVIKEKSFIDTFWVAGLFLGLLGIISYIFNNQLLYAACSLSLSFIFNIVDVIIGKKKYGLSIIFALFFSILIFIIMPRFFA